MAAKAKKAVAKDQDIAKTLGVAPAAVQAVKQPSLDDLLGDSVKVSPKKSGSTQDIRIEGDDFEQAISDYLQALSDKADAEAALSDAFALIAPKVETKRVELSRTMKDYQSSLRVNARLTYVGPSQFCKIKLPEDQAKLDGLAAVFAERFGQYFGTGHTLKVKGEALDATLVVALKEACAKVNRNFNEVFETEKVATCAKTLHKDRILLPDIGALFSAAETQGFIKPFKATLKE